MCYITRLFYLFPVFLLAPDSVVDSLLKAHRTKHRPQSFRVLLSLDRCRELGELRTCESLTW
jgi:hypothetical protein